MTATGREYSVYFGPNGDRFQSKPQCWRHFSAGDNEDSDADSVVEPEAAPPSASATEVRSPPVLPVRVPGRSKLCNKWSRDKSSICSLPFCHDGLCDFEVLSQRNRARP